MRADKMLSIGRLAEETGVKVETIRYYEQVGLMPPPDRTTGNQRRYSSRHLERLAFIRHARDLGFPVASIRTLLHLSDTPDLACDEAHGIAAARLAEVRHRIRRLRTLEKELERISAACAGGGTVRDCAVVEALAHHAHDLGDAHGHGDGHHPHAVLAGDADAD